MKTIAIVTLVFLPSALVTVGLTMLSGYSFAYMILAGDMVCRPFSSGRRRELEGVLGCNNRSHRSRFLLLADICAILSATEGQRIAFASRYG
jgi:hypothetical protein